MSGCQPSTALLVASLLFASSASAWAAPTDTRRARGPQHTTLDLLRPYEGFPKVFVQARLPDGELGTFLVDTGADISVLTRTAADRLDLVSSSTAGTVAGISDSAEVHFGTLPWLRLGDEVSVSNVEVAIGLPGVQDHVDMMPIEGILGNNVWSNFLLELDYRANQMRLHAPGTVALPKSAVPMQFHRGHAHTVVRFTTDDQPDQEHVVVLALDTGANEVILIGDHGLSIDGSYSVGLEPVLGVTTSDVLPASALLRETRRIPLDHLELGGMDVDVDFDARWLDYDRPTGSRLSVRGLVGHDVFEGRRVWFDYSGGQFALSRSKRRPRFHNGHLVILDQDRALHGEHPSRWLHHARLLIGAGDMARAESLLHRILGDTTNELSKDVPEARVLLARLRRLEGDLDGAWKALAPMSVEELVSEGELVSVVNGLLLEGKAAEAEQLSHKALEATPDEGDAWVARADVLLWQGHASEANRALVRAAKLAQNPDAHLLRRARVALSRGDHDGALTMLRSGVQLNPLDGKFIWFYAQLAQDLDQELVRFDITRAERRTHPRMRPLDFLLGARTRLGDEDAARELFDAGILRDCGESRATPAADNCRAWYYMLAGRKLDEAQRLVDEAIEAEGSRSDFLDTKAMVHLAKGEVDQALEAAIAAAKMAPSDPYMLWQAERIAARRPKAPPSP